MFSSLLKNHTPYKQLHISGLGRSVQQIWRRNTFLPWPKLWNLVPNEYKTIESPADFKAKIKTWVPESCPYRLCKTYIHQIGFI